MAYLRIAPAVYSPIPARMLKAKRSNAFVFSAIVLLCAIFLVFFPALGHDWVFDDSANFLENEKWRGLNTATLAWMWTTSHMGHFIPISWMTLGLDYELWEMDPFGFHLSNLLWHWLTSLALLVLLRKILQICFPAIAEANPNRLNYASLIATLFFALHPMRVESVVWITERRDMVSTFFLAICCLSYLVYVKTTGNKAILYYSLSLFCFLLAMLSKPIVMTLPAVLMAMDFFPLARFKGAKAPHIIRIVAEKIPFFVVGFSLAWHAYKLQFEVGLTDWLIPYHAHDLWSRILQVGFGACYYVGKTLIPVGLSPIHILTPPLRPDGILLLTLASFLLVTVATLLSIRRYLAIFIVWLTYGILLSPVLGLTQNGPQIVADRYSYLGCLPFVSLLSAGILLFLGWKPSGYKTACYALIACALLTYGWLAYVYTGHWKNQETLWTKAIAEDPNHYYGFTNRGRYFHDQYILTQDQSYLDSALSDYNRALEIRPTYSVALNNRSVLLMQLGQHAVAMRDLNALIETNPNYTQALYNRARLHIALGNHFEAKQDLSRAIATASPSFYRLQEMKDLLASIEVSSGAN